MRSLLVLVLLAVQFSDLSPVLGQIRFRPRGIIKRRLPQQQQPPGAPAAGQPLQEAGQPLQEAGQPLQEAGQPLGAAGPTSPPGEPPSPPVQAAPRWTLIAPGTVLAETAPEGWTHLILKTQPKIAQQDRDEVNQLTAEMTESVFTSIVARVVPANARGERPFELAAVGLGLGMKSGGQDLILSPDSLDEVAPDLGIISAKVLQACYEKQALARLVVLQPDFGLLDTHAILHVGGRNLACWFRYALVVDPATGDLQTWVWPRVPNARIRPPYLLAHLPPDLVDATTLFVDADQFFLGIPNDLAFGVAQVPTSDAKREVDAAQWALANLEAYTAEQVRQLRTVLVREGR